MSDNTSGTGRALKLPLVNATPQSLDPSLSEQHLTAPVSRLDFDKGKHWEQRILV